MLQLAVGEQQRIPTREQHIAHLGVLLDVAQTLLILGMKIVVLRVGHEPAARAVAAVGRAAIGHQKKHPVRIAVHQPWHR